MPRPGGEADKVGNYFESIWTVDAVIDVFLGKFLSITVEAFGEDSKGTEFYLERPDGTLQFHSAKRQKTGGDWSIARLCRKNKAGRSILGDLFSQRRKHPGSELRFVSATGANELRELSERAEAPIDFAQFKRALSPKLQFQFDKYLVPLCDGDEQAAWAGLKSLEVIPRGHKDLARGVDRRIDELFYRANGSELRPNDVRRMIAEYVLDNLGPPIGTTQIRAFVGSSGLGLREWKTDGPVLDSVARANSRYLSIIGNELINAAQIARQETKLIDEVLVDPAARGALLVAPGGFGKSCVLAQCVSGLISRGIPTLSLRMDSLEPCNTAKQLGKQLDLPASPVIVLAGIADNAPSVLVVDQLDAMSLVSGRHPKMWEVFSELCEEVRSYPNMRIVLACRDFDLNHDHRLRSLGDPKSGFTKVTLGKLKESEIRESIIGAGQQPRSLSERQLEILGVPFHLLLFLQGDPSRSFASAGELYDRYWDRKRQKLRERLGRESRWTEVIDALTDRMSRRQVLFAAKDVADDWEADAEAMISEHVLVEAQERSQVRFFHESFFDYAYARRFCATGGALVEFLCSTEQHLFRRAQVRQILAYRREHDFHQYIQDMRELFESPRVRFHIKRMVASGLRQVDAPASEEWSVIEPYLLTGELSRHLSPALRGHVGWFDLLDKLHVFEKWLASDDEELISAAVWYLEAPDLHDQRSANIAGLVSLHIERGQEWRNRIIRIMSWGKAYKSDAMAELNIELIRRGSYDDAARSRNGSDEFWDQYHDAPKEAPRFMIDVVATWFDRVVDKFDDGQMWNFFDKCEQNRWHAAALLIGQAAASEPRYFVQQMLPRVVATVLRTESRKGSVVLNRAWPSLSNNGEPFEVNDAILLHLRKSLQWLSQNDAPCLRQYASTIFTYPHETFGYLLLRSWADNSTEFADDCAKYLLADKSRLNIGYGSWSTDGDGEGESAISRIALQAISPHCSPELFKELETAIIGYCDEYEKQTPRARGFAELLVLRSLDKSRIASMTALRIEELERKFPNVTDAIVEEDHSPLARCVGSPIPDRTAELMTDDQWICAMEKYDGSTDRFRGGPVELSRTLAEHARKQRQRFGKLVLKIPDTVKPIYFSAILDGISSRYARLGPEEKANDQLERAAIPTELFLEVIERLDALPGKPCGDAIVGCVGMLSDRKLPARTLDVVAFYAMSDVDPETDVWQQTANGSRYYGGSPFDHGINCVRGQAALAISSLLFEDASRVEQLRPALEALAVDPVISVRTCAIRAFLPMLNFARDEAVGLFLTACTGCEPICGTPPFEQFVHYAIYSHYPKLRELLQFALTSADSEIVEIASLKIVLAEINDVDVGNDASSVRSGNEAMRKAAARVYVRNLSNEVVGRKCEERLLAFCDDEAESVRQELSGAFWNLTGEQVNNLRGFIAHFIESKSFQNGADRLLQALEKANAELPDIICLAADRVLECLGDEGSRIAHRSALVAHSMSALIVRQYEQAIDLTTKTRCLDLIDRMERIGSFGIGDELSKIDR